MPIPQHQERWKLASLALIPIFFIIIEILVLSGIQTVFEPPYLLLITNTIFVGIIPLFIAYLSFRTYSLYGRPAVLLIGGGMLAMGMGSILAALVRSLPDGANLNVTVYNTAFFVGAVFAFSAALANTYHPAWLSDPKRTRTAGLLYTGVGLFILLFTGTTLAGLVPRFFTQDIGPTLLRQGILISAIVLLAASAVMFYLENTRKKEDFFFWMAISFGLLSIGLFAFAQEMVVGGLVGWFGRTAEYVGACYALVAYLGVRRTASAQGVPVEEMLAQFFGEAEVGYRALVEASTSAIVVLDPADRVLVWNPAAERMFGYPQEEAVGTPIALMAPGVGFLSAIRAVCSTEATGNEGLPVSDHIETIALRKDGNEFPVDMSVFGHPAGSTWARTCIIRDITDRKSAEEALKVKFEELNELNEELVSTQEELRQNYEELMKAEHAERETSQYLENLIGYANAPIIVWDPGYRITRFNHAFELLTGKPAESMIGKDLAVLFPDQFRDAAMEAVRRTSSGERMEVVEIPILDADGAIRTVLWNSATLFSPDGTTVLSTVAQGQDITERKNAEESLKNYAENLKQSNEDLERFAYVASHDLREPLRMVTSFSQLLEKNYKGRLDADADEFIDYIVEGGRKMDALVNDLLEYSRITSRGKPFEPTDMNIVLEETRKSLSMAIKENKAKIEVGVLPTVYVDRSQVTLVFQNLLSNAIKFHDNKEPVVSVGAVKLETNGNSRSGTTGSASIRITMKKSSSSSSGCSRGATTRGRGSGSPSASGSSSGTAAGSGSNRSPGWAARSSLPYRTGPESNAPPCSLRSPVRSS
ncbi:PAS domain S-box-containing protein [Methanolinea mesophila]|nr:PAS domain-containing sensor histidine kinase [Methanolinea mesophila]MBP1927699.1 PAS domain S-box-containing protein [Methanolinea mesophila]